MNTNVANNLNAVVNSAIINPDVLIPTKEASKQAEAEKKQNEADAKKKQTAPKKDAKKNQTASKKQTSTATKTAVKTAPKKANTAISTQKDALKALRDANKETKTLSGVVKTIRMFWKDGYREAFAFLKMDFNDMDVKKIMALWTDSLKDENGVFMYKSRVAKFKMNKDGNKEYILDKDGKKQYETILKQYNNNFSVLRLFDAMLTAQIEKGIIAL